MASLKAQVQKSRRITSGDQHLDVKIKEWLSWDKNKKTSDQIKDLVRNESFDRLKAILMKRLTYGLDGFHGPMQAGYNAMNDLVVIQCAQGMLKYLEMNESQKLKSVGVVVGFDGRHNSRRFAELVTTVFVQKNYGVRMYNVVVPTYFVPYAISKYGAAAGVMICANIGPNTENGLQIYESTGCQSVYPLTAEVESFINENLEPNNSSWETSVLTKTDMRINPLTEVLKSYLEMIFAETLTEYKEINRKSSVKFTYSALHGVGFIYMARAMDIVNVQIIPVEEQKYPNPDFTNISVPDFRGDIKLVVAMNVAQKARSDYIIANNTDCSRVVVAEKSPNSSEYKFFNADEIAILLAWWTYHIYQDRIPKDRKPRDIYMVGSIFSTKLTKNMARTDGFYYVESFGGKWLGTTVKGYVEQGKNVIFGYDEYGYIVNTATYAKDGIYAGVHLGCLINYLHHHKMTLREHLERLYKEYGYYLSIKFCFTTSKEGAIKDLFNRLRNYRGLQTYPRVMGEGKFIVRYVRDLKDGLDTAEEDKKSTLPHDAKADLITLSFDNGMVGSIYQTKHAPLALTLHTSIVGPGATPQNYVELKTLLTKMTYTFIEEFVEPVKNNLSMEGMEIPGVSAPISKKCD